LREKSPGLACRFACLPKQRQTTSKNHFLSQRSQSPFARISHFSNAVRFSFVALVVMRQREKDLLVPARSLPQHRHRFTFSGPRQQSPARIFHGAGSLLAALSAAEFPSWYLA
jgi:hypothetical protein